MSAARALRRLGTRGIAVKWPNDLMMKRRKLGGILIETRPAPREARPGHQPSRSGSVVIVGIGINCRAQPRLGARLGRGVAALEEAMRRPVSRNTLISAVAREVLRALLSWERVHESIRKQAA